IPGYCASKALPSFSPTGRSMAEYSTTLASFFAASINCGVIACAGGASARAADANTVPSANAVEPFSTSRRESLCLFIASILLLRILLSTERAPAFGRQKKPDLAALGNGGFRARNDAQRRAVGCFDHVVAACAEKYLPRHRGLDRVLLTLRHLR